MALKLSTGLRNKLLGQESNVKDAMTALTISFGDGTGTGGLDQILDSGSGLAGFTVGDYITVTGSTSNDGTYKILSVAAGAIEIAAGSLTTEAAGDQVILAVTENDGALSGLLRNCVMRIYSGSQPTDADTAESGTLLVEITESSGAFSGGSPTNGLNFDGDGAASGVLSKESAETWSGAASAPGTAGWFRIYANAYTTGSSTTAVRFDGSCGTSGAQLNMASTSITASGTVTIDSFSVTLPASA